MPPHPSARARRAGLLALLLPSLALGACGYALVGRGTNIPPEIEAIFVEPLVNETRRSEVEQILTRAISEELVTRKRFDVVGGREEADAVLRGAVTLFQTAPISFDPQGRATEYQITINARMAFEDHRAETVLWQNDRYVYRETYAVDPASETYFDRENLAIEEAAERFARTLVIDLLEGF